jgi:hypothetical protein
MAWKYDHMWPKNTTTCSCFFLRLSSILSNGEKERASMVSVFSRNEESASSRRASDAYMTDAGKGRTRSRISGALRPGPIVPGHTIQYAEDQHAWVIDQTLVLCSELEYHCLRVLFERANHCVPFEYFVIGLQGTSLPAAGDQKHARMRIAHLISHLRAKIWAFGLEIVSVMNVGYILLSESEKPETPS